jgi:hypothetical protein
MLVGVRVEDGHVIDENTPGIVVSIIDILETLGLELLGPKRPCTSSNKPCSATPTASSSTRPSPSTQAKSSSTVRSASASTTSRSAAAGR